MGHAHRISRAPRPMSLRGLVIIGPNLYGTARITSDNPVATASTASQHLTPPFLARCLYFHPNASVTSTFQRPRSSRMSKSASYSPVFPLSAFHSCPWSFSLRSIPATHCVGRDRIVPAQVGIPSLSCEVAGFRACFAV